MCRSNACGCGGGSGVPVILAIPVILVTAAVVFVLRHEGVIVRAALAFVSVMAVVIWAMQRSVRQEGSAQAVTRGPVTASRATAPRAVTAPPKAIGGRRVVAGEVLARAESETIRPGS